MTLSSSRISKEYYFCHMLWHCMNQRNKHPTLQFLLLSLPWRCMNQRNKAANPTITTSVVRCDTAWIKGTSTQPYNFYFCHALWHCINHRKKVLQKQTAVAQADKTNKKQLPHHATEIFMDTILRVHQQSQSVRQGACGIGHHALPLVGHYDQLTVVKLSVACVVPCCCIVAVRLVNVR